MQLLKKAFIPMKILSQNKFMYAASLVRTNSKGKKYAVNRIYQRYKKAWKLALMKDFGHQEIRPDKKRYVKITHIKKGRRYDDANFRGGAKPIPDILQDNNWIRNDNMEWVDIDYEQRKPELEDDEGTVIEVYDLVDAKKHDVTVLLTERKQVEILIEDFYKKFSCTTCGDRVLIKILLKIMSLTVKDEYKWLLKRIFDLITFCHGKDFK